MCIRFGKERVAYLNSSTDQRHNVRCSRCLRYALNNSTESNLGLSNISTLENVAITTTIGLAGMQAGRRDDSAVHTSQGSLGGRGGQHG